uniref:Allyl alcohol dehydrogenase-like protein n=1 Tax=Rhizophora mucronata TaxID=61149 RepID=A0A2P2NFT0_RHIMU
MGLLSWFKRSPRPEAKPAQTPPPATQVSTSEVPGMNGAVEVPRPAKKVTIFEFGSVAASADKVTLAGYCPVSDELEPCRWEILPANENDAPQFRVVF